MILADSRKKGTASRMKALYALVISPIMRIGVSRGLNTMMGRQASPSANATGTRRMIRTPNVPKRMRATSPGDIIIPPQVGEGTLIAPPHSNGVPDPLADEQGPDHPHHDIDPVDENHVDAGQLRGLDPAEGGILPPVDHKNPRKDQHETVHPE